MTEEKTNPYLDLEGGAGRLAGYEAKKALIGTYVVTYDKMPKKCMSVIDCEGDEWRRMANLSWMMVNSIGEVVGRQYAIDEMLFGFGPVYILTMHGVPDADAERALATRFIIDTVNAGTDEAEVAAAVREMPDDEATSAGFKRRKEPDLELKDYQKPDVPKIEVEYLVAYIDESFPEGRTFGRSGAVIKTFENGSGPGGSDYVIGTRADVDALLASEEDGF